MVTRRIARVIQDLINIVYKKFIIFFKQFLLHFRWCCWQDCCHAFAEKHRCMQQHGSWSGAFGDARPSRLGAHDGDRCLSSWQLPSFGHVSSCWLGVYAPLLLLVGVKWERYTRRPSLQRAGRLPFWLDTRHAGVDSVVC